jgi:hypothetical protein
MGDDVYHEPSTVAFEAHVAKITGKDGALFLPSGTMSNQIALRTHLVQPPYSVLCDHRAHIHKYVCAASCQHYSDPSSLDTRLAALHFTLELPTSLSFPQTVSTCKYFICDLIRTTSLGRYMTLEDIESHLVEGDGNIHLYALCRDAPTFRLTSPSSVLQRKSLSSRTH